VLFLVSQMNYVPLNRNNKNPPRPQLTLTMNRHPAPLQSPSVPFNRMTPIVRPANMNVQQKLAALTLRLEKELESESTVGEYYGQCTKCNQPVTGSSEGCQAMGELYHNDCFKCIVCSRMLRGKAFYRIHDQIYCEEDYLVKSDFESKINMRKIIFLSF